MTIRVMPSECLPRSDLLAVFMNRTVVNKAFGGHRRWGSIYPLAKRIFNIRIGQEQLYKALQPIANAPVELGVRGWYVHQ